MLSPNIPTGPRNPNGYTSDEVLRAIRGVDGSREVRFRYELLDRDMKYKRDLDNILGGSVQMQYISEIKRTANFDMLGGAGINWLDDHIKPYYQLRMPARMVDDGIPVSSLWENSFNAITGDVTEENSGEHGDTVSRISGTVRYWNGWCALGSDDGSDAGGFSLNFRARRTWKFVFYMAVPTGSYLNVFPDGLSENEENYIRFDDTFGRYRLGSVDISHIKDNLFGVPVRVEVLNDGYRCRYDLFWTNSLGSTPDFTVTEDSSGWDQVQIISVGGGGFNRSVSYIDEIQVSVPGDPEMTPRTVPVWENNFNGEPEMVVDSDSLSFFGSSPSETSGNLSFNGDWSVDSLSSLQLGDTSGRGSMQLQIPPRADWNLKFWANVPEGSKLFVCPSNDQSIPPPGEAPPWAGPIQKVGTSGSYGYDASILVPTPSGTVQGDYMISTVSTNDGTSPPETSEGWNLLASEEFGEDTWVFVYGKFAESDEPAQHEFTFGDSHWHTGVIQTWRNTTGPRYVGISSGDDITSVNLQSLGSIEGDTLVAMGFDWSDSLKTWIGGEAMALDYHMSQGFIVSSLQGLPGGSTPSFELTTNGTSPTRLAAVSVVMAAIPDTNNPVPYPGAIEYVGFTEHSVFGDTSYVPAPSGMSPGDLMISVLTANDEDGVVVVPSGWDLHNTITIGDNTSMHIYYRFVGTSEPSTYEWGWEGGHWHNVVCTAWRNVVGIRGSAFNSGVGVNSVDLPSQASSSGDTLLAVGFDWAGSITSSFNDDGEMDTINVGPRGVVSARMDLPGGPTPEYALQSTSESPTRMIASSIILEGYTDPGDTRPFRGPSWIVIDDEGGEYSIGGTSLGQFRDLLVNRPIRIELETSGGVYNWSVYSNDPMGNAPDLNWYGSSEDWEPIQAVLVQGGGVDVDGSLVDNLTLSRALPTKKPTPEETNFVEFPLGVFMMSSPVQKSDEDDVITREVEAYDRTKLFIDDKLTERLAVKKGEVYTDIINDLLGDIPKIVEPSTYVVGRDREWSVGTSIKEVIDACAESINYHTLRFDEDGRAVVEPYVSPDDRSPEFHYADDDISIMRPEVDLEFDTFDIANIWLVSISEVDQDPVFVKLENQDPGNPFSVPRRGRRIVDFRQEETATDRAGLMRKAKRIQYEANREYESIAFKTLTNPLHSANDCYTVQYGPLGIDEKYTEINWEFSLEAGSEMTHTARRVVKLDAEDDPGFIQDRLEVNGSFSAGNVAWGSAGPIVNSKPSAPVSYTVTGLNLKGSGRVDVFLTPETTVPNNFRYAMSQNETPSGFTIWIWRSTGADSYVQWLAMRNL